MATTFVEVNDKYYNSLSMGKVLTKTEIDQDTQEEVTKYFFQYFGGQDVEIDQQTYQDIIDGKYDPSVTVDMIDSESASEGQVIVADGDGGASFESLRTLNGNSLIGDDDLTITTYQPFPSGWNTQITSQNTIEDFCADVDSTDSAVVGMVYLGELEFSSTPFIGNAEAVVEIVAQNSGRKTIHILLSSGTDYPYHWEYTYWTMGGITQNSGWIGFQTAPKVVNNVSPTWVSDATYADYGYKGTITISGVTSSMRPEVTFGVDEALSGNYAPICNAVSGGVEIYGKVDTAITIPTVVVYEK